MKKQNVTSSYVSTWRPTSHVSGLPLFYGTQNPLYINTQSDGSFPTEP